MLCYFNKKPEKIYDIFRYFYKHHLAKLMIIESSNTENLVALCVMFERLFLRYMNQLYIHLRTKNIFPVQIASNWLYSCFIGVLSVETVFQIFDRMVGYNSTHFLVIVALSYFKYYEKGLLEVSKEDEISEVFQDIKELNLFEIINFFLFELS